MTNRTPVYSWDIDSIIAIHEAGGTDDEISARVGTYLRSGPRLYQVEVERVKENRERPKPKLVWTAPIYLKLQRRRDDRRRSHFGEHHDHRD
jgi:hypothetical protein